MITILLLLPFVLDASAANARLSAVRAHFSQRSKQQSMRELEQLVDEAPGTDAAARASEWLGDLWRTENDDARAEASYRRAHDGTDRLARALAARGLGDIAIGRKRFSLALALYSEARTAAESPPLDAELDLKMALARRLQLRARAEWACWLFVAATMAWLLARSRFWSWPRFSLPTELIYVVPVYTLLTAACIGRDPKVLHALWLIAVWSAALIGSAAAALDASPPQHRLIQLALLTTATLALLYAAMNRAGLIDSLLFTVAT